MFFLCVYLFFPSVFTSELTTKPGDPKNFDVFDDLPGRNVTASKNDTELHNKTIFTQRITQPSQSQKIERILETDGKSSSNTTTRKVEMNKSSSLDNFKPSPQLEAYYEFNKFPVIPALPESKTFGSFSNPRYSLKNWDEKPTTIAPWSSNNKRVHMSSWFDNSKSQNPWEQYPKTNAYPTTTEQPWISRVKFPSSETKENPYKFIYNDDKLDSYLPPSISFPTSVTTEGFSFNKPVEIPNRNINKPHKSSPGFWQKLMGTGTDHSVSKNGGATQKTFFDYNLMEKPPHYDTPVKEYDTGISSYSSHNPWTKIIKLLTAIVPIGLFISALTPTVITVTSVNDTQSRYRSGDSKHEELTDRLASSIKYAEQLKSCEDKILCELLVTASSSKNSADNIRNLLDTFTEHEDLKDKKDDLLKVFEAVKKEDCSSVVCKSIKNPS